MNLFKKMAEKGLYPTEKLEFAPHMKEEFQQFTKVAHELHTRIGINLFPFLDNIEVLVQEEPVDPKLGIHVLE